MDYLDKSKQIRENILLWLGYLFIAIAIVIATLVLVYQAYGFNVGKNGNVVQSGLVFFSSHPSPADIYLNNTQRPEKTNSQLIIPSGVYKVRISRSGYNDWTRNIVVNGGTVEHFDYPFLFPKVLTTKKVVDLSSAPNLAAQSPDRRWILSEAISTAGTFTLYDLKDPAKIVSTTLTLPSNVVTPASSGDSWQYVAWADDNVHVLLNHLFNGKNEYILVDRSDITQSVNLSSNLNLPSGTLVLNNKKYNTYELLDTEGNLKLYSLNNPTYQLIDQHVTDYKSYGKNTFLIINNAPTNASKVPLKLIDGGTSYVISHLQSSTKYLLDLTAYSGNLYVAAGSSAENKVYVYADPVGQLTANTKVSPVPTWILHVKNPNYLSFSKNAQFILAENAQSFAVYDIENDLGYVYSATNPIDPPQSSVSWMDGNRISYVSNGKLLIEDYDNRNISILSNASANYLPFFAPNYKYVYLISNNQLGLEQTPLLTPKDL